MNPKFTKCLLFVTALCFFINKASGQDSTARKPRVYLGASVSTGYLKQFYPEMSGAYLAIRFVPTVPVRTGIDVKVRLTNKLYLSTGVQYDFVVQKIEESHIWVAPGGGLSKFKYKTTMGYFEVPLRIDLRFSKTRFSTFLTAGGYAGVFFRGKSTYENTNINGIPYQYSTDFRYNSNASLRSQMYSNLQLGYGLDVNLNQLKFQFFPFYEAGWLEIGGEYFYRHRLGAALSVLYGF